MLYNLHFALTVTIDSRHIPSHLLMCLTLDVVRVHGGVGEVVALL